jgi:hypothetical protein
MVGRVGPQGLETMVALQFHVTINYEKAKLGGNSFTCSSTTTSWNITRFQILYLGCQITITSLFDS